MPIKFIANRNCIIFGPSGSGKTEFMLSVIRQKLVEPMPKNIYYMYNIELPFMRSWNEQEPLPIKFIKGLNFDELDTSEPSLLVIDDLVLSTNKSVAEMFILGSHHRKVSTFFLTQALFSNCDVFRLMSRNCHTFVIFHSQRNFREVRTLATQCFGGKDVNRIYNAYKRASKRKYGNIVLNFDPDLPEEATVVTDWWEVCPSVYL
jgi:GTPase SAR1 family protein